jgi:hypothetical protein
MEVHVKTDAGVEIGPYCDHDICHADHDGNAMTEGHDTADYEQFK